MSYRKPLIGVIIFFLISALLTWTVYVTLQRNVTGKTESYSAVFTDVSGLRTGDDVRVAGVRVGRVDGIDLDGTNAKVTFKVQDDQKIYGNTKASVTYQNLIGQRYLGLSMGAYNDTKQLQPGGQIPIDHTEPSFDISKLLNGFEPLFSMLDPKAVDNITNAIVKALQGDNGAVTTLIAQTSTLAESFAGPDQILGNVIQNLSGVVANLSTQSGNLETVIQQTKAIFEGLDKNRKAMFDQVDSISKVVGRASDVVNGVEPSLTQFVTRQPGFAQHFVDNKDKFEYFGFNVPILLKGITRLIDHGAFLDVLPCNITTSFLPGLENLIPTIVAAATPSGKLEQSTVCR